MAVISGDTLEGVSATTPWTLHNRGTAWSPLDRIGLLHRNRLSITLLEFDQ